MKTNSTISYFKNLLLFVQLFLALPALSQKQARLESDLSVYNFGVINETDGYASHTFLITNKGDEQLVIKRVTASCGCMRPEWEREPIAPGKSMKLTVSYDPNGRPGPFYKTIALFSNASNSRYTLAIKGFVKAKPEKPAIVYPYTFEQLALSDNKLDFYIVRPFESLGKKINVRNDGTREVKLRVAQLPNYLKAVQDGVVVEPGKEAELSFVLNANLLKTKGHYHSELLLMQAEEGVSGVAEQKIKVVANYVDALPTVELQQKAPQIKITVDAVHFEESEMRNSKGSLKKKIVKEFDIANIGSSMLNLYSVACDNKHIRISKIPKTIKPGMKVTMKVTLYTRFLERTLDDIITVVSSDPKKPVQMLKISAEELKH